MRKDDIIGQKLFETCKLSEFYLNLVVNCKEQDESPLQLARAYKQKLYEIVDRYDRLLDANRQRQQLSLTFDKPQQQQQHQQSQYQSSRKASYHHDSKTSTPNKTPTMTPNGCCMPNLFLTNTTATNSTPSAPVTPSSSFASTPTTPFSQYQRSLPRQSSFNQAGRSFIYSHNSTKYQQNSLLLQQQQQQQQQYSLQRNKSQSQQQSYSSLSKTNKLLQQYAFLYDDYDSADEHDHQQQQDEEDEIEMRFPVSNKASATTGLQSLSCKLNYEAYSNTFNTNLNRRLLAHNQSEYNQEIADDDYAEEGDVEEEEEEEFNNDLSESQIIEKSYSNLSKDSGVFADSYHSDYSNCAIGIGNNESSRQKKTMNGETKEKTKKSKKPNNDFDDNSSVESNKTIDSSEEYADQIDSCTNKTILSQDENDTVIDENTEDQSKLIWGSITRLVESDELNASNKNTSSILSSSPINSSKAIKKSNTIVENFDEENDEIDETYTSTVTNQLCAEYASGYSSSTFKKNTTVNLPIMPSASSSSSSSHVSSSADRTSKELKFLNTNSLMNVSMLDNIQATNTHLDFDNMNTSILMFN